MLILSDKKRQKLLPDKGFKAVMITPGKAIMNKLNTNES